MSTLVARETLPGRCTYALVMSERQVSVNRVIKAAPAKIFDVLADPAQHAVIDGSGSVKASRVGSVRLTPDASFSMDMKQGVPYRIKSRVVEFDEGKCIAWAHFGKHRWRYELEAQPDGSTRVTETFDWSTARSPRFIELMRYPKKHPKNMEKTLERLAALVEGSEGTA